MGGGHGLHATLSALRTLHDSLDVDTITAVVTVADNGGSSGRLRQQFGVLPPGDLRMALAALCGEDEWGQTWAQLFQHRFGGEGDMQGHAIGNLVLVGLWELMGDHVRALDWAGTLLGARGRVLPMATTPMDITALVRDQQSQGEVVRTVRGQVEVASAAGDILSVALDPVAPEACPEAVQAILTAEWVVLGPGSWFTSVIPHLMVPGLRQALLTTSARIVVVLNLTDQEGETQGFGPCDHVRALARHAPGLEVHAVVADRGAVPDVEALQRDVAALGATLVLDDVAVAGEPRHDPVRLAATLRQLMTW
ncbi:uridine diphosphate-N-acetylglucosamine-binding protein YvcK [Nocardioides sp. Y6]|uniref:Putative gluconeogenesis factor n=1 Tax=Nocardioides malaquae TaxID=2773426 RepID=A0ABR9RS31_9ACTN|nr:uridine diphosphate-N-acetylglucosamine-binding protein YvcK [Nocardioides malaquae]MBE7324366.1 uridine diphosphate-N-acetylglucosamine-binding protein YvcK [Nocardioides malaquae]